MGLYEYVGGMPTIFMDPMGLLELPDWAKGAVSAVARVSGFGVVGAVAEAVSPGIAGEAAGVATEVASNVITPVVTSVAGSVASLALGKEARAAFAQILGAVDEDLITCACLSAGIVDIALGDPATELIDCACNIMTAADLFAEGRSAAGWAYLTLTVADCLSTQIGAALGAAVLSLVGASGGTAAAPGPGTAAGGAAGAAAGSKVGAVVGGVIIDVLAMGAQNLITQDTVLPKEQYEACCRVGKKLRGENKTKCTNHG
jgi:outer membrane lipoprotein SlyB